MNTFKDFRTLLTIKRYSSNTIETYIGLLISFQKYLGYNLPIDTLTNFQIINEFTNMILKSTYGKDNLHYSQSTQKQLASAIKLYFKEIHSKEIDFSAVASRRPKQVLPTILSKEEVKLILKTTINIKHKAMLTSIYALGLRSGELLNLKIIDLDGDRNQIFIKAGKGRKDRVLPFPKKLKELLREYFKEYKPKDYMFEGRGGKKYTPSSLRAVMVKSLRAAKIRRPATLHTLRHSYATHLMDAGTDVRIIKELLGHNNIKTTLIYTHVTKRTLEQVPNPLDFLE